MRVILLLAMLTAGCAAPPVYRDPAAPSNPVSHVAVLVLADPATGNLFRNGIALQAIADLAKAKMQAAGESRVYGSVGVAEKGSISEAELKQLGGAGYSHVLRAVVLPQTESTTVRNTAEGTKVSTDVDQYVMCSLFDANSGREVSNTERNAYRWMHLGGLAAMIIPGQSPEEKLGSTVAKVCGTLIATGATP